MSTTTIIGIVTAISTICQVILQMFGVIDPATASHGIALTAATGAVATAVKAADAPKS